MERERFRQSRKCPLSMPAIRGLFVVIIGFISLDIHGQHQWQRISSPVDDDLYDVFFVDDTLGWACSYVSSAVIHTRDGGQTWRILARFDSLFFVRVQFIDASHGWLCGDRGVVYKTTDGGNTWIDTSPTMMKRAEKSDNRWRVVFYNMYFFGPDEGFVVGVRMNPSEGKRDYYFLRTEDGGESWIRNTSVPEEILYSTVFVDEKVGFTTGAGTIYRTMDRGMTWTAVYEGPEDQLRGLFFLNKKTGWVCGFTGRVIRTTDGGRTWKEIRVTPNRLRGIGFVDDMYGIAVGDRNTEDAVLYQTYDGGETWHASEVGCPDLFRLHLSPGAVWIVGRQGTILRGERAVNLYEKEPFVIHVFMPEGKSLPGEFRLNDGRQVLVKTKEWEE